MRNFFRRGGIAQLPRQLGDARMIRRLRRPNASGERAGRSLHAPELWLIAKPSSAPQSARRDTDRAESRRATSRTANDPCPERFRPVCPPEVFARRHESARGILANAQVSASK